MNGASLIRLFRRSNVDRPKASRSPLLFNIVKKLLSNIVKKPEIAPVEAGCELCQSNLFHGIKSLCVSISDCLHCKPKA